MRITEILSTRDKSNLKVHGYEIVEVKEIGDYNLTLVKIEGSVSRVLGVKHQIGFSKSGTSFTEYSEHGQKFIEIGETVPLSKLGEMIETLKGWVKKYQHLLISSSVEKKTMMYKKLLKKRGFEIDEKTDPMGHMYLIISL